MFACGYVHSTGSAYRSQRCLSPWGWNHRCDAGPGNWTLKEQQVLLSVESTLQPPLKTFRSFLCIPLDPFLGKKVKLKIKKDKDFTFIVFVLDKASLCILNWPGTCYVAQNSLRFMAILLPWTLNARIRVPNLVVLTFVQREDSASCFLIFTSIIIKINLYQ